MGHDLFQIFLINFIEICGFFAVDIQHGNQFFRRIKNRHDDFRDAAAIAGDMTGEIMDIINKLRLPRCRRRAAKASDSKQDTVAIRAMTLVSPSVTALICAAPFMYICSLFMLCHRNFL